MSTAHLETRTDGVLVSDIGDEFHPCGCVYLVFGGGSASIACNEHGAGVQTYPAPRTINEGDIDG